MLETSEFFPTSKCDDLLAQLAITRMVSFNLVWTLPDTDLSTGLSGLLVTETVDNGDAVVAHNATMLCF